MNDEMMKALEADGEKLRQLTGEDHGPHFLPEVRGCGWRSDCPACVASKFTCDEHYGLIVIHKPMIVDAGNS